MMVNNVILEGSADYLE